MFKETYEESFNTTFTATTNAQHSNNQGSDIYPALTNDIESKRERFIEAMSDRLTSVAEQIAGTDFHKDHKANIKSQFKGLVTCSYSTCGGLQDQGGYLQSLAASALSGLSVSHLEEDTLSNTLQATEYIRDL